jgi:mannose-6-phosphate isomerase-like protein (cupin superfamily)
MPSFIKSPSIVKAEGNEPKIIQEFIGRVSSKDTNVSVARMRSPAGWEEPGQTPEFVEYTIVLSGTVRIKSKDGIVDVKSGEAIITQKGEWIQYSTPGIDDAEYISVCLPAFSPSTVHRDSK